MCVWCLGKLNLLYLFDGVYSVFVHIIWYIYVAFGGGLLRGGLLEGLIGRGLIGSGAN